MIIVSLIRSWSISVIIGQTKSCKSCRQLSLSSSTRNSWYFFASKSLRLWVRFDDIAISNLNQSNEKPVINKTNLEKERKQQQNEFSAIIWSRRLSVVLSSTKYQQVANQPSCSVYFWAVSLVFKLTKVCFITNTYYSTIMFNIKSFQPMSK